jgi:anthranilate phosphoribosyltransferase
MKAILEKRIQNQSLTKDEAKNTLLDIGQGKCNSHQVVAFLTTYMMRPITVDELSGFRAALLDLCIAIDLSDYVAPAETEKTPLISLRLPLL